MQCVDTRALDDLDRDLERVLKELPAMRREFHERMGALGEEAVQKQAPVGKTGKVRRWQVKHIGSGGGYAAIRARKGALPANRRGKAYSFGYITNAINSGHAHPAPSGGKGYRYRNASNRARTPGLQFYQSAGAQLEPIFIRKADALIDRMVEMLNGG